MADAMFRVDGREYEIPGDLTLGEMCDAEQFFGVEFGQAATSGMRMAAALLYIAIRRVDPSVTVEDVRNLPPEVFANMDDGDAVPPVSAAAATSASGGSGEPGNPGSGNLAVLPAATGHPGSEEPATFDPVTSTA